VRWITPLVLGVALVLLGAFIALRPLFTHFATLTGPRWLDVTFAFVFIFRGYLNIKTALQRRAKALAQG
jgi:hypothetical protein